MMMAERRKDEGDWVCEVHNTEKVIRPEMYSNVKNKGEGKRECENLIITESKEGKENARSKQKRIWCMAKQERK